MTVYQLKAELQELCDNFYSDYEIADLINKRIEIE